MHHVTHVVEKRHETARPPAGSLRYPAPKCRPASLQKKEKAPCTSAPRSHAGNDKIKRHPIEKGTILSPFYLPYLQLHCQFFGLVLSSSYTKTSLGWIDEESGLSMEETDAPLLFQQGLPSISPYYRRKRFVRVITKAAQSLPWKHNALAH